MTTNSSWNNRSISLALVGALAASVVAWVNGDTGILDDEDDDEDIFYCDSNEGIDTHFLFAAGLQLAARSNGAACAASPFNCKFRVSGGNRVTQQGGDEVRALAME